MSQNFEGPDRNNEGQHNFDDLGSLFKQDVTPISEELNLAGLSLYGGIKKVRQAIDAAIPFSRELDVNERYESLQGKQKTFDALLYLHLRAGQVLGFQGQHIDALAHFNKVILDRRGAEKLPTIFIAMAFYEAAKIQVGYLDSEKALELLHGAKQYLPQETKMTSEKILLGEVLITEGLVASSYSELGTDPLPSLQEGATLVNRYSSYFSPLHQIAFFTIGSTLADRNDLLEASIAFQQGMSYCLERGNRDAAHRFLPFGLQMCLYSGAFERFDYTLSYFQEHVSDERYYRSKAGNEPSFPDPEQESFSRMCTFWTALREWMRGDTEPALELLHRSSQVPADQREVVKSIMASLEEHRHGADAQRLRGILEHIV